MNEFHEWVRFPNTRGVNMMDYTLISIFYTDSTDIYVHKLIAYWCVYLCVCVWFALWFTEANSFVDFS